MEATSGPSGLTPLKWGWNKAKRQVWSFFISFCLTGFHSLLLQFPSSGERRLSARQSHLLVQSAKLQGAEPPASVDQKTS